VLEVAEMKVCCKIPFISFGGSLTALNCIKRAGFEVSLSGETFTVSPASRLTDEQRKFLRAHKAEIIRELAASNTEVTAHQIDDRHLCRECLSLNGSGYCIQHRFRPVDDILRRCDDFHGLTPVIDRNANEGRKTSEAEHNAQGRYFKYLITRTDGTQFYSHSMPRKTLEEIQEQYPDPAKIEPVENEHYPDEE
jgi:hypothetical protein